MKLFLFLPLMTVIVTLKEILSLIMCRNCLGSKCCHIVGMLENVNQHQKAQLGFYLRTGA